MCRLWPHSPRQPPNPADFRCIQCGHTDNADLNAALVIRKRAIQLIFLDSGTELAGKNKNVLRPGTGANRSKTEDRPAPVSQAVVRLKMTVGQVWRNASLAACEAWSFMAELFTEGFNYTTGQIWGGEEALAIGLI